MADTQTVIRRNVRLDFPHSVHFTREAFLTSNDTLAEILRPSREGLRTKLIVYLDEGLLDGFKLDGVLESRRAPSLRKLYREKPSLRDDLHAEKLTDKVTKKPQFSLGFLAT